MLRQLIIAGGLVAAASAAQAQSMSPMRGEVTSFTDAFALRVYPANPYKHRIKVSVQVYDQDFRRIPGARVAPQEFMLGGDASRGVNVIIPFDGGAERKVRVCTESIPFPNQQTQIKAQICGRFLGQRRS